MKAKSVLIGPSSLSDDEKNLVFDCCLGGQEDHVKRFYSDSSMKRIWKECDDQGISPELQRLLYWIVASKIRDWPVTDRRPKKEKTSRFSDLEIAARSLRKLIRDQNIFDHLQKQTLRNAKNSYLLEKTIIWRKSLEGELQIIEESAKKIIDQIEDPFSKRKKKDSFSLFLIDEILISFKELISSEKRPLRLFYVVAEIVSQVSGDETVDDGTVRERANNFSWYPKIRSKRRNQRK